MVEIGWTWFNPQAWRTGVNVETKLLMLAPRLRDLGCVRVELKTDARNERSRAAMAALPAQFEGILRNHMIVPDVGQRDSAYYSVIDSEWPAVRANLERRLARWADGPSTLRVVGKRAQSVVPAFEWVTRSARCAHFLGRLAGRRDRLVATRRRRPRSACRRRCRGTAFLKRSVRRSGGKRSSAFACFFGWRSP